jgi:DNA-binding HxlR family transcriptional regulator
MPTKTAVKSLGQELADDRLLLDEISSKWTILVLGALCPAPLRFNELRRSLDAITQKALTQCLRRLELNGIVHRRVISSSPVAVTYEITPLGRSLEGPLRALQIWTMTHRDEVLRCRRHYLTAMRMDGQSKDTRTG